MTSETHDAHNMLTHAARANGRTQATRWSLDEQTLRVQEGDAAAVDVDLGKVVTMWVRKAPSAWDVHRYRCDLDLLSGKRVTLISSSWVQRGRYESRADTYTPLVQALAKTVHQAHPACRFRAGSQPWVYGMMIAALGFLLLVWLMIAATRAQPLDGSADSLIGLIAPICMIAMAAIYCRFTLPRAFHPHAIPETFLP